MITNNTDIVAFLGHAAHELSHIRREFFGERSPYNCTEKVQQQPKERPEEIKQFITQLKNSVSNFPLFNETTLWLYLPGRCDTFQAQDISHSLMHGRK